MKQIINKFDEANYGTKAGWIKPVLEPCDYKHVARYRILDDDGEYEYYMAWNDNKRLAVLYRNKLKTDKN